MTVQRRHAWERVKVGRWLRVVPARTGPLQATLAVECVGWSFYSWRFRSAHANAGGYAETERAAKQLASRAAAAHGFAAGAGT